MRHPEQASKRVRPGRVWAYVSGLFTVLFTAWFLWPEDPHELLRSALRSKNETEQIQLLNSRSLLRTETFREQRFNCVSSWQGRETGLKLMQP